MQNDPGFEEGSLIERERLRTVDLLILTILDQLLYKLEILFTFFTKQVNEEVNCNEPSPSVSVPWFKKWCLSRVLLSLCIRI